MNKIEEMTEKFKKVKTYEDLEKFIKELYENNLSLRGKISKNMAFGFHHMYRSKEIIFKRKSIKESMSILDNPKYINKVLYLFDDGVNTGESYVKNLARNLEVY